MNIDTSELLALPAAEKLQIVELLWDNLGESESDIPLPDWADQEGVRRRDEMIADPSHSLNHKQVWDTINGRTN